MTLASTELYHEIGRLVEEWRRRKGMSQEDLARAVNLTRASISNIERGRQQVYVHTLFLLGNALGVPPEQLVPFKRPVEADRLRARLAGANVDEKNREMIIRVVQGIQ